jgi:branched-chain amino acid transport system permease protein
LAPLISAIGMSIILQNFVQLAQGARVKTLPPILEGGIVVMSDDSLTVNLSWLQLGIIGLTIVLMTGLTLIINRTAFGRAQRACEQDPKMAALLGINVDRVISATFVIGAVLASVAGLMVTLYYGVIDFYIGFLAGVKAFTAAVLGGIGSLPGALLGGLAIGLIEALWSAYFSIEYKDVAAFSVLVLVLLFRPTGILGRTEVEKI